MPYLIRSTIRDYPFYPFPQRVATIPFLNGGSEDFEERFYTLRAVENSMKITIFYKSVFP